MEYDREALELKKKELRDLGRSAISESASETADAVEALMQSFVRITPPTKPEMVMEMITMESSGRGGGRSRKPGNIFLNWRKLMDLLPDIALAGAGGATLPRVFLPAIALYIWNKLWRSSEEDLSEHEAMTIFALWKNRDGKARVSEDAGFVKTNDVRKACNLPPITKNEFARAIRHLVEIDAIEVEDGIIWLREWVRITY